VQGIEDIRASLPHRYPFLLVDKILEVSADGTQAVGIKNVTINEPFFQGHFPQRAIMPGVLIIEALAQTGGVVLLSDPANRGQQGFLAGVDKFRFRRPVVPGDTLRLEVTLEKMRGTLSRIRGRATVDGQLVAEGEILVAFASMPEDS
jgi:3-hydroxyacyl-[acyl-carrier-protein] dehydratase